MAISRTTLAATATRDTDTFYVTSSAGASVGGFCKVNGEYSTVLEVRTGVVKVRTRGERGGKAVAHALLSPVVFGTVADLATYPDTVSGVGDGFDEIAMGADGAITIPKKNTRINITKATAAALTLAQPGVAVPDGIILEIRGYVAAAHTVTLTAGFFGNTTSSDVATFAAGGGGTLTLKSVNGIWQVVGGATAGVVMA
ncbi:MAG: hypothetical protein ACYC2H_01325 [Thermoplasmatota archaeon]